MNSVYGYARVSSTDQNAERQHLSLQRQGIPRHRIFTDRMSGKDFRRPRYEDLLARSGPATSSASRASIAWAAIMRKYSGNGGCSRRNCMWTSLYWTCRCWIPGGTGTCWGPSLPTSCCRCSRSWPRASGKTSGDARRKASPLHGCGAFAWDGNQGPCLPIFPKCTNCGRQEKSPLSKTRNSAAWHGQHSITARNP